MEYEQSVNTIDKGNIMDLQRKTFKYNCGSMLMLILGLLMLLFVAVPRPVHADDLIPHLDVFDFTTYDMKPKTESVDNANWKVQLKNATCQTPIQVDVSSLLGKEIDSINDIKVEASVNMSTTTEFEIEFKKANWRFNTVDTDVKKNATKYSMETFDTTALNNIFSFIPYVGSQVSSVFKKQIVGAATAPCTVKGKMTVSAVYTGSLAYGAHAKYESTIQIYSIEPKDPTDQKVTVFVGDYEHMNAGFLSIPLSVFGISFGKVGPIISCKAGIFAGDIATWEQSHDEWEKDEDGNVNPLREAVHTCTENGKPGCITGQDRIIRQTWYDWDMHIRLEILTFEIFDKHWDRGEDEDYTDVTGKRNFRQSLTFREQLAYSNDPCPHHVYRIPVATWLNEAKTIPIEGMTVKPAEEVQVDENVRSLTEGVTRKGREEGNAALANLYLPYKEGKYKFEAVKQTLKGEGEQPSDMVRSTNDGDTKNERVDIIVGDDNARTLSVKKEWDIDYENKDKPESVEVVLEALFYSRVNDNSLETTEIWLPVQILTLSDENNWQADFDPMPRFEAGDSDDPNDRKEIRYRIRELKVDSEDGQNEDEETRLLKAVLRVVHARNDLDRSEVLEMIGDNFSRVDEYFEALSDPEAYLERLGKKDKAPLPYVTYEVPAYTSSVGERIDEHETKYIVEYSEEEDTTTIRNTAVLDISAYKRWINLTDEETPDSVWLILQSRVKEEYLSLTGEAGDRIPYTPVMNPLYGDKTSIKDIINELVPLAGDILGLLDPTGLMDTSFAAGEAKKDSNLLKSYKLSFGVKKYSALKLPLDFEAGEITSEIIKMAIKVLTGIDCPVSFDLSDMYVSVPGKAYNIFRDWELTSNVINIKADLSLDDDMSIGGTKYWKNDEEEDRPAYITVVVKDEDGDVVGKAKVEPQSSADDSWVWALTKDDLEDGTELDPDADYTISEEFPEGYQYADKYVASIDGYDITNTWATDPKLVIEKHFEDEGGEDGAAQGDASSRHPDVQVRLINDLGEEVGVYTLNEENGFKVTLKNGSAASSGSEGEEPGTGSEGAGGDAASEDAAGTVELTGHNVNAFRVEELTEEGSDYVPAYSGPSEKTDAEGGVTYTFTVTNREQKNVVIHAIKEWKGDEGQERPEKVKVTLKRGGVAAAEAELSEDNSWKADFTEDSDGNALAAYDENGAEIVYTLGEETLENYSSTVESVKSGNGEITFTVTNTWTGGEDKVTVKGRKTWVDDNNARGTRPESIEVIILANGSSVKTLDVREGSFEAAKLPRSDEEGNPIRYSVIETAVDGYITKYDEPVFDETSNTWTCNITNTISDGTVRVEVKKVWEDKNDERGLRPDSVGVTLYGKAAGAGTGRKVASATLTADGDWAYTFTGLKRYDKPGVEIEYSIIEDDVPNYTGNVGDAVPVTDEEGELTGYSFAITNTVDSNMRTVRVIKEWNDSNNSENTRPESVTIRLTRDGEDYLTHDLTEEDGKNRESDPGWTFTFNDLPIGHFEESTGEWKEYRYDVLEDPVPGYETSRGWEASNRTLLDYEFIFTNRLTDSSGDDVHVKKTWDDDNNAAGARPQSIKVALMQDGHVVRSLTLTGDAGWEGDFKNVPNVAEGGYTLREDKVQAYSSVVSGDAETGFTVTNTFKPSGRFAVTKVWDDNESMERPQSITVALLANGTEVSSHEVTADDNWRYVFEDLPLEDETGGEIEYTIDEVQVPGYISSQSEITGTQQKGVTTWQQTITNRLSVSKVNFTVRKEWLDEHNNVTTWPEGKAVTVHLKKNGEELSSASLTASEPSHVFENLDAVSENGSWITYEVWEDAVQGYETLPGKMEGIRGDDGMVEYSYTFKNRIEGRRADIPIRKVWDDNNSPSRPDSVTVHLYTVTQGADGEVLTEVPGSPAFVTAKDNWTYVFKDMPLQEDGQDITYKVTEDDVGVPCYKSPSIEPANGAGGDAAADGFVITNTWWLEASYKVVKKWDEPGKSSMYDPELYRPDSIRVYLTHKGEKTDKYVDLTGSKTAATWEANVPLTEKDKGIFYDGIVEEPVPGYIAASYQKKAVSGSPEMIYTVTNEAQLAICTVKKIWKNEDGSVRPESADVWFKLLGEDGTGLPDKYLLMGRDNTDGADYWVPYLTDENGKEVPYTIREIDVPVGYKTSYKRTVENYEGDSGSGAGKYGVRQYTFTITNTSTDEWMTVKVHKVWQDGLDDAAYDRPTLMYGLYADGEKIKEYTAGYYSGGWDTKFGYLPLTKDDGTPVEYTIVESAASAADQEGLARYVASYDYSYDENSKTLTCTITNTLKGYQIPLSGSKIWIDNNDAAGLRPQSITVHLLRDGAPVDGVDAKTVTVEDEWKWDFGEQPALSEDGKLYEYSVAEDPVFNYTMAVEGMNVINTYDPKVVDVTVTKRWNDAGDAFGIRPESVEVKLYRSVSGASSGGDSSGSSPAGSEGGSNVEFAETATLSAGSEWAYTFTDMPQYDSAGNEFVYTVEETPVNEYNSEVIKESDYSFAIVNTPKNIDITVTKVWNVGGNSEAEIPDSLEVYLYANGESREGYTASLSQSNNWTWTFEDQPRVTAEGAAINYTVEEEYITGFRGTVSGPVDNAFTITNTPYTPVTVNIPVRKVVVGDPDKAETFTFKLTPVQNGNGVAEKTLEVAAGSSGEFSVECGNTGFYPYILSEVNDGAEGWTYDAKQVFVLINVSEDENGALTARWTADNQAVSEVVFTNRYQSDKIDIYGQKTWDDNGNEAGLRPESITIRLMNGDTEEDSAVVTADTGWKWSFTDLDSDGDYSIKEDEVDGYEAEIDGYNVTNKLAVTPTPVPEETVTLTVIKEWDETDMPTPTPKPTPTFMPMPADRTYSQSGGDEPAADSVVDGLPEEESGSEYSVAGGAEGGESFDGFSGESFSSENGSGGPGEAGENSGSSGETGSSGSGTGTSAESEEDSWPKRPESVTVHVMAGSKEAASAVLSEATGWSYTFTDLPYKDDAGIVIPYTIIEDFVEGYDTEIRQPTAEDTEEPSYFATVTNKWTGNKTDVPTVTKKVKETVDRTGDVTDWQDAADYDIGDSIPYRITGTLPSAFAKFKEFTVYTFVDTLSEGLTPPSAENISITKNGDAGLSLLDYFDVSVSGQVITVSLKNGEDMRKWTGDFALTAKDKIVIEYEAVLNENAVVGSAGNPNDVALTYTDEHDGVYDTGTTPPDKVTVFTYTIVANKVDGQGKPLKGAGFTLFKEVPGDAGESEGETVWEQIGEELKGEDTATFTFKGVDAGRYKLEETTVPEGYNKASPIEFRVVAYYDTDAPDPAIKVLDVNPPKGEFDDGELNIFVFNQSGTELPSTGGPGTWSYYVIGILTLAAAALLRLRREA